MMSLSQCTPLKVLPATIKMVNVTRNRVLQRLQVELWIRLFSCNMVVGMTHITNKVVEEG